MYCRTLFLLNIFLCSAFSKHVGHRDRRYIRGTYTVTEVVNRTVTELVPSPCVSVAATLPPCRNVRFLNLLPVVQNHGYDESITQEEARSQEIEFTTLGWGEYFGIYAPTVTIKETRLVTDMVPDPKIVVTLALKGCKPAMLPWYLDRCPGETRSIEIRNALPTSTVMPTPTATIPVSTPKNTKVIDVTEASTFTVQTLTDDEFDMESLDSSQNALRGGRQYAATDPLPF